MAKEYSNKILSDIDQGYKSCQTLDKCIDSTATNFAAHIVPAVSKSQPQSGKSQGQGNSNSSQKICTTWNTFKNGEGCHYEYTNPGQSCVYLHHCSTCRQKGFPNRRHKAINCNFNNSNSQTASPVTATVSAPPVVVTSV